MPVYWGCIALFLSRYPKLPKPIWKALAGQRAIWAAVKPYNLIGGPSESWLCFLCKKLKTDSLHSYTKTTSLAPVHWAVKSNDPRFCDIQICTKLTDSYNYTYDIFLYCCPDCPSCLAHLNSIGWAAKQSTNRYFTNHSHWFTILYQISQTHTQ